MPVFFCSEYQTKNLYNIYMYSKEAGEMVASLPFIVLDRKNKKELHKSPILLYECVIIK